MVALTPEVQTVLTVSRGNHNYKGKPHFGTTSYLRLSWFIVPAPKLKFAMFEVISEIRPPLNEDNSVFRS